MNRIVLKCIALLLITVSWHLTAAEDHVYTVGIVPQYGISKTYMIWQPILAEISERTGYKFKLVGSSSISKFEREVMAGAFDFAYMNAFHLVVSTKNSEYLPLFNDHGRELYGVLVVKKDSPITSPEDLAGQRVAFPSPNALGASLKMRQELTDVYGTTYVAEYVKSHDSVYLNVLMGVSAAGGGVYSTLNSQPREYRDRLRVIHETERLPPHPFSALNSVPEKVRQAVVDAFLDLNNTEQGRNLLMKIPIRDIGVVTMADYQPISNMGLDRFYISN